MLLEVKDLKTVFFTDKKYVEIIHGIDLAIGEDEVVGLVGESGCGKSVTAFSIMRLLGQNGKIISGQIIFDGKDIASIKEKEMLDIRGKSIAMIFQEPFTALNPVMRVGQQIKEALIVHKKVPQDEARSKVIDLLKSVRIEDPQRIYYDYPHQLSGGQRQRVLIATALALRPKLLIADEPTTALDVTTQSEILKLLLELKKELRMSILFITHDFGIINEVAHRVCVMKDGRIVERGEKDTILKAAKHPYTKRLLEAVPRIEDIKEISMPTTDTFIEVKNISKSFPIERGLFRKAVSKVDALNDVNLVIKKGRTTGLVGESGCGKSTLGKIILGLVEPDKGQVLVEGGKLAQRLKDTPMRIRQMMQIVFQDPYGSLDPRMKMADIVLEGPSIYGKNRTEKEAILRDVLNKVHLSFGDSYKYPHQFSGGERQRIAIARALALGPLFLVLDEPVSSLDVLIQKDILDLLKLLQKELLLTYLFISHNLGVVEVMSDDVAVMYKGSIVEFASRTNIYKNPQHPYTKTLLSSIPNLT